jgi:hypothetical protein
MLVRTPISICATVTLTIAVFSPNAWSVDRLLGDADLPRCFSHRQPELNLLQHRNNLLNRKPLLLHGKLLALLGPSLPKN